MSKVATGKVALAIILLTETVLFATLLAAYVALRSQANWALVHSLPRLLVPILNTTILLASAWSARQTHVLVLAKQRTALVPTTQALTLALGLIFVAGQAYEFAHAGLRIDDQAFGGVFFALMGFHAVHILAGVVVLAINLARPRYPNFSEADATAIEIGSLFWYYVVAVWLVLFTALYLV